MKDPHRNKHSRHVKRTEPKSNKRRERAENVKKRYTATVMDVLFRNKLQDMDFEKLLKQGIIKEIKDNTTGVIK